MGLWVTWDHVKSRMNCSAINQIQSLTFTSEISNGSYIPSSTGHLGSGPIRLLESSILLVSKEDPDQSMTLSQLSWLFLLGFDNHLIEWILFQGKLWGTLDSKKSERKQRRESLSATSPLGTMELRNGRSEKGHTGVCRRIKSPRGRKNSDHFSLSSFVTGFPGGIFGFVLLVKSMLLDLARWSGIIPGVAPGGSSEVTNVSGKNCSHKNKGGTSLNLLDTLHHVAQAILASSACQRLCSQALNSMPKYIFR